VPGQGDIRGSRRRYNLEREKINKMRTVYKLLEGCLDCGVKDTRVLEFDHRNPNAKSFTISSQHYRRSTGTFQRELDKCDVVCANCHHIRDHARGGTSTKYPEMIEKILKECKTRYDEFISRTV